MADLLLERIIQRPDATIGVLSLDGEPFCWTLEDAVRQSKIYAQTAIPSGVYQVVPHEWEQKGILVPKLLKVPFFEGIYIHSGNTPLDTSGCILVGRVAGFNRVEGSGNAFKELMGKIYNRMEKTEFFIEIKGGYPSSEWIQPDI
jgi:hypothetical protein